MMYDNIEFGRICLRKATREDTVQIWKNVWSNENIASMMLWPATKSLEGAKVRMERTIDFQSRYLTFFVCLSETDEPIGLAGVRVVSEGVYEECGIAISEKYQGQGYGKETVMALNHLVFDILNGEKVTYGCFQQNVKSANLCKCLGYIYTHSLEGVRDWDGFRYVADYYELIKDDSHKELRKSLKHI